jgi:hypothetical protein
MLFLGLCNLKKFRRKEKSVSSKKKRSNPLKTSSPSFVHDGRNLGGHWLLFKRPHAQS